VRARWAGIVVAALALAGCGGVPASGPVEAGSIIDAGADIDVAYNPGGPLTGATQTEIMLGFISAATNPQNDYSVARSYLAESIRDEWDPNKITQIRTGIGQPRTESDTAQSFTLTSAAHVDENGQYIEDQPATQVLDFTFVQDENDQWRIASAPPGIVLSRESFNAVFEAHPLYFYDATGTYLVPDLRWFPKTTLLATTVVRTLLEGQAAWLREGVTNTYFPAGTKLDSRVVVESGVATVALSDEVLEASPEQVELMRQQLRATIGNVSSVVITAPGVTLEEQDGAPAPETVELSVQDQLLARQDDVFGFLKSSGAVGALAGVSTEVIGLDATDATLSRNGAIAAVQTPTGAWLVFANNAKAVQVDTRAGLLAPALDNSGFVWTVPASDAAALVAHDDDGNAYPINAPQFAGMQATSFSISRDGSRVLLLSSTTLGPRLSVAGIIRTDGVPTGLGPLLSLPIDQSSTALDATWVDGNTIATLTIPDDDDQSVVTSYQLGGPSTSLGRVTDGVTITGGNGADGIRVVTSAGDIYRPRGNGWADTGTTVTFLATQQ